MITEYNDPGKLNKKLHLKYSALCITRLDTLKEETREGSESREKSLDKTGNS